MPEVRISAAFVTDRDERELPTGDHLAVKGGRVLLDADESVLVDMMGDAAYQGWHTDADLSVRNAAQAAFRHLHAAGVEYARGVVIRNGRAAPGDA